MKKELIVCSLALLGFQSVSAQNEDTWIPQHVALGVGIGTTGINIDASTMFNRWIGVRAGVDIVPKIKVGTELDLGVEDKTQGKTVSQLTTYIDQLNNYLSPDDQIDKSILPNNEFPNKLDVEGQLNNTTFHFLVDVYPFKNSSFHATVGAYVGPSKVIKVYNKEDGILTPIYQWNNAMIAAQNDPTGSLNTMVVQPYNLSMIGAELGDYFITPNPADNGNVEANIKVSGFRPYVGLGFGRAVPKKRIGCQFDLGVQFWGSAKVVAPTYDKGMGTYSSDTELQEANAGSDAGGVLKTISKVSVYPVLNFRLVGRIF